YMKRTPLVQLDTPIEHMRSVGPRNLSRLQKLGIKRIRDLLWHLPVRYDDYSEILAIRDIEAGQKVNIQGEVVKISSRRIFPRRLTIVNAIIKDASGAVRAVWFNQPYIETTLAEGTRVSLAGKAQLDKKGIYLSSPVYEKINSDPLLAPVKSLTHTARLVPVYPETEGISSKYLRFLIQPLLEQIDIQDPLSSPLLEQLRLPSLRDAVRWVHFPLNQEDAELAKERLAFNDLLFFQLKALLERRKYNQLKSVTVAFDKAFIQEFIKRLPFDLTHDQKVAAWEILQDLERPYPMNRLLEGDVGSGKTAVALIASVQVAARQGQTVFLAPTEVLAAQHFQTIRDLVKNEFRIGLITSTSARLGNETVSKNEIKKMAGAGSIDILIGTHAVIQKDVRFSNLALVVIDEQHRFGIEQRATLIKDERSDHRAVPHLLSMTATPIPRTLALTIFGDLDISLIKEKPKDRRSIITKIIPTQERPEAYSFIHEQVRSGRQVFVICPRIEAAEESNYDKKPLKTLKQDSMQRLWSEVKAVQAEYEKLSKEVFPDLKIAMLHGKMKPKEKQRVMEEFKQGWHDILVSTSVIEVGIDIPNATLMLIEGADRFGLAQLHQFRGRVGRGAHQSYCFLLSTGEKTFDKRLQALVESNDGFALAEKDMALRGPGEFFGIKQSGMPDLTMTALANMDLIKKARLQARLLLRGDPSLQKHPLLREQLDFFQKLHHFE
ncbi:MAG: ATP-dependent DNA helicase RecG, partial [Candidatus Yanofskybacteria bacterium]|nr:ATP-dependent DNA helicase RecG [Candidatus Yanofskybacteria bacterium]